MSASGDMRVSVVIGAALAATFNSTLSTASDRMGRLGDSLRQTRLGAGLAQDVLGARAALDRLRQQAAMAGQTTQQMAEHIRAAEGRLRQAERAARDFGIDLGRVVQQERELARAADLAGAALARQQTRERNSQVRGEAMGQLMGVVGAGYAMALPVREAIRFESAMADVAKVGDFKSKAELQAMGKDILELSTKIPLAGTGFATIITKAEQFGIKGKAELLGFAADAAKMGVAFDMSADEAGDAMTGLRSQFRLGQKEVVSLGDAYNHLSNNMGFNARDLVNIANRVGAAAKQYGMTGESLGALGAVFLKLKTPPEIAATAIKGLMTSLGSANTLSDDAKKALHSLGFSATRLQKAFRADPDGTILSVLEKLKGQKPERVMEILTRIFGKELADDIAKIVTATDDYRKALGLVANQQSYAGSMEGEYAARADTTANNLQILENQVSRMGITLGNVLLPHLNTVATALGVVIDSVGTLAEEFPVTTEWVVGTAVALLGLKAAALLGRVGMTLMSDGATLLQGGLARVAHGATLATTQLTAANLAVLRGRAVFMATAAAQTAQGVAMMGLSRGWQGLLAFDALLRGRRITALPMTTALKNFGAVLVNVGRAALFWGAIGIASAPGKIVAMFRGIGPAIVRFGAAIKGIGPLLWRAAQSFPLVITGLRMMGAAFIANPVGLGIAAIAGGALLIYKYWEPIGAFFAGVWRGITEAMAPALAGMRPLLDMLSPIGEVVRWIGEAFSAIVAPVVVSTQTVQGFADTGVAVGRVIGEVFGFILSTVTVVGKAISAAIYAIVHPLEALSGAIDWVGQQWRSLTGDSGGAPVTPPAHSKPAAAVVGIALAATPAGATPPAQTVQVGQTVQQAQPVTTATTGPTSKVTPPAGATPPTQAEKLPQSILPAARPAATPASPQGVAGAVVNQTFAITVQGWAGMDEKQLTALIRREIERAGQAAAVRARAALHDSE